MNERSAVEKIRRLTNEEPIFTSKYELMEDEPFPFDIERDRMADAILEKLKNNNCKSSSFFIVAGYFLLKAAHFKNTVSVYVSCEENYGVIEADMTIIGIDRILIDVLSSGKTELMMFTTTHRNDIKGILVHIGMPLFTDE